MKPAEQARGGRCGAKNTSGEPCICSRWRGHAGQHRGPSSGEFYGGSRYEWDDEETFPFDPPFAGGGHRE